MSKSSLVVSPRGQITLPASLRRSLGLKEGGVVTVEERRGEIILRPATILEVDMYSDDEIKEWDAQDKLDDSTRESLKKKKGKRA